VPPPSGQGPERWSLNEQPISPELGELVVLIAQQQEIDGQYIEPWSTEHIADVRSAGHKAGRLLG
jgi:hypothetical protein